MTPAPEGPGDSDLAGRARSGDVDAFAQLVRRHEASAIRIASLICGSAHAEDAAQEAFVRAFRSLHRFDTEREFRPWFIRILTNVAKNTVRSERRYLDVTLRAPHLAPGMAEPTEDPDTVALAEQRAMVLHALMALPERDRLILACRWFEEMSEKQIADALDLKPGTVKSRLSRAMDRLREQLATTEAVRD
jgi:RNA polymerase sigma factor (sigma-70 family)